MPPVSAYDNTAHSHSEFVSTAQGGPDERALLIDTFPGTLPALFRRDSCLPHPRGQLCQDTPFMSVRHPYMLMGFPEPRLRYCFLFAGIGAFVLFHSGGVCSTRLVSQIQFREASLKIICKPDLYLHFTDLNTPDLY